MEPKRYYTRYGFPSTYWEKKKQREALEELVKLSEDMGMYDEDDGPDDSRRFDVV